MSVFVKVRKADLQGEDEKAFVMVRYENLKKLNEREEELVSLMTELQTAMTGIKGAANEVQTVVNTQNRPTVRLRRIDQMLNKQSSDSSDDQSTATNQPPSSPRQVPHTARVPKRRRREERSLSLDRHDTENQKRSSNQSRQPDRSSKDSSDQCEHQSSPDTASEPHRSPKRKRNKECSVDPSSHSATDSKKLREDIRATIFGTEANSSDNSIIAIRSTQLQRKARNKETSTATATGVYDDSEPDEQTVFRSWHGNSDKGVAAKRDALPPKPQAKKGPPTQPKPTNNRAAPPNHETKSSRKETPRPTLSTAKPATPVPNDEKQKKDTVKPKLPDRPHNQNRPPPKALPIRSLRKSGNQPRPMKHEKPVADGVIVWWQHVPATGLRFNKPPCMEKMKSLIAETVAEGTSVAELCGDDVHNPSANYLDVFSLLLQHIVFEELGDVHTDGKVYLYGEYNLANDDRTLAEYMRDLPPPIPGAIAAAGNCMFLETMDTISRYGVIQRAVKDLSMVITCRKK